MSDSIKHECAVALLRLLEPPSAAGFDRGVTLLSLLLEKQHNRGQDGAGAATLTLSPEPGNPAWHLLRCAGANPLADLLGRISRRRLIGESLFLGHLRYATYGKGDESFCHPFVHAEPRLDRTLFLAGNFNLTNTHELFDAFQGAGNHPSCSADGYLLCELLATELADCSQVSKPNDGALGDRALPSETQRTSRTPRENEAPNEEPPILRALRAVLPKLDGAFTLCGMTGDGWAFAVRDAHGIRPGWYLATSRAVAVASERPAIQAAFDVPPAAVRELPPGEALLVSPTGEVRFERVLPPADPSPCAFERIYFSRANDADIQRERRALGAALLPQVLDAAHAPLENIFFSYIPNSAQIAFHGLLDELLHRLVFAQGGGGRETVVPRFGQVAVKDAKFRTFIADAAARREIGKHVYDVTYGLVRPGIDTLVVLDDSIVRGNTMREAILPMLDRLGPRRIVVASSAPPIRYPDCYGIDMSTLGELVAFRALVNLLGDTADAELQGALARGGKPHAEFAESISHAESAENAEAHSAVAPVAGLAPCGPHAEFAESDSHAESAEDAEGFAGTYALGANPLASLYARFSDAEHCAEIARLLTPPGMRAEVCVVYQTVENLHRCLQPPAHTSSLSPSTDSLFFGDWYFTGDYPTLGGYRVLHTAIANYLARNAGRSY